MDLYLCIYLFLIHPYIFSLSLTCRAAMTYPWPYSLPPHIHPQPQPTQPHWIQYPPQASPQPFSTLPPTPPQHPTSHHYPMPLTPPPHAQFIQSHQLQAHFPVQPTAPFDTTQLAQQHPHLTTQSPQSPAHTHLTLPLQSQSQSQPPPHQLHQPHLPHQLHPSPHTTNQTPATTSFQPPPLQAPDVLQAPPPDPTTITSQQLTTPTPPPPPYTSTTSPATSQPASATINTPPQPPHHIPRTSKPTPSIAPTLSTTRGIWRDPDRSPPRTPEHHRYSAFPAVPSIAPSQATSRSRSRTRSLRTTRSPLPRRRSSATQSVASSQAQSKPADRPTSQSPAITQDKAHTSIQNITPAATEKHTPEPPRRASSITLKPNPHFTPKHSTQQTPPPPPPAPIPAIPVQRRPHNLPPPTFQPPTDPAQLEVFQWLNRYAQALDVNNEPMLSYVAKVLSAAHLNSTHFTDLQLLTHKKWCDDTNKEEHFSFLLLTIPTLASRGDAPILPPTRREALNIPPIKHIFAAHVSEEGNIISILEAGEIVRSILHDAHNVGYFCQAFELSNYEPHDAAEAARVLFNASNMAKNRSGLILTIKAYGHGQKVTHGGESAANDLLLRGEGIVKYTPGKCWVAHPKHSRIEGIAWKSDAKPPLSFI